MSVEKYAAMARRHWTRWLPKKVKELKVTGQWEQALQQVGKQANQRVMELMQQGFQQHEAEEVIQHELLLLKPEPDAKETQAERKELARLEAEYQKRMLE